MPKRVNRDPDRSTERDEPQGDRFTYRWTCPYCRTSRVYVGFAEDEERYASVALRRHITVSEGAGHGPRNELPADGPDDPRRYVVRLGRDAEG